MANQDYYALMGVSSSASQDEIKRAYRKLARKYHPDVSKESNAEEKFKALGEAYDVLKDSKKRKLYDQYGTNWQQAGESGGHGGGGSHRQYHQYSNQKSEQPFDFEDVFGSIFGNQRRYHHQPFHEQGHDIHAKLAISLADAYHGSEKVIQLSVPEVDSNGQMIHKSKSVKIKIPAGIIDKQQIRLKGQGAKSAEHAGDLYIEISLLPHPLFKIDKKDLHLLLPVTPSEALLGKSIDVPTLDGHLRLTIPKGSQTGKVLRLKGKGLPGKDVGNLFVTLNIVVDEKPSDDVLRLYEELDKISQYDPRAALMRQV